jgi:hypothetical protein
MLPIDRRIDQSNVSRRICVNYLNLIVDPLSQELVQCRGNATIGMNPIMVKNNTS